MVDRIQFIHTNNVIHRDIKPDNFLIGKTAYGEKIIYLIDFGLCKKYINRKTSQHIKFAQNLKLTGTARYASIGALKGYEQSRRDDIEAIGYVLMYFIRGSLPWQGLKMNRKDDKFKKIYEVKKNTTTEELTQGYPAEFFEYLNYSKNLEFEETPDYEYLRNLFKNLMEKNCSVYDLEFDWITRANRNKEEKKDLSNMNNIEGQFFQKIKINGDKINNANYKPAPIILNKINPTEEKKENKDVMKNLPANYGFENNQQKSDYFYEKSIAITNKATNGTVDGKSTGKSLVDMVKNEKTSGFGFNIDERINRILSKNKEKDYEREREPRNGKNLDNKNTENSNSKSNYNSLYSLETRETISSSRYKLCSLAKGGDGKIKQNQLDEIREAREDTYYAMGKTKVCVLIGISVGLLSAYFVPSFL